MRQYLEYMYEIEPYPNQGIRRSNLHVSLEHGQSIVTGNNILKS
jgi:hypothetical protein